ncbi:hypothetical protein [Candidatus Nitrospira nitrificans]|uniref:Uncharacterized protein n=1 Tax=Candidatus Nitrospira nitrificans TaxID=1742973 RepID=A0A0S4LNE6_9BACT|nr:hypothetical protein [Candidatus Nitrospira nitrificans]CUS39091.1 hypothetical protein COMA2_60148 [Candidatus Nitrospira nitrificans]
MPVQALTSVDPHHFFNLRRLPDGEVHRLDTRVSGVAVSNEFSGRLAVTTAEGDRITFTADLATDFRSESHISQMADDRTMGRVEATYTHYAVQRDFGLAVEGDLNKEELHDLKILFGNIATIFRGFFQGEDEVTRAHTTKLAEGFRGMDSLSGPDLSVDVVRSVVVAAASHITSGGAPAAVAAIPQPSNGTTAPTPSSGLPDGTHLTVPVKDAHLASLIQQVLDALKDAKVELEKVRAYLPDFFEKLRDDLVKEFHGEREPKIDDQDHSIAQVSDEVNSPASSRSLLVAYRTVTETSFSLSMHG